MGSVRDEDRINASLCTSLVKEEHVVDTGRADRHHTSEPEAAEGTCAEQCVEIWGYSGANTAQGGEKDGKQRDWPPAVIIGQGGPDERRNPAKDNSRRGRVSSRFGIDAHGLAEKDERWVDERSVVRAQEGHEADLDEDCPLQPRRPVLLQVNITISRLRRNLVKLTSGSSLKRLGWGTRGKPLESSLMCTEPAELDELPVLPPFSTLENFRSTP